MKSEQENGKDKAMVRKSINLKTGLTVLVLSLGLLPVAKAQKAVALVGGSPAMSYVRELLKRKDVQNELGLDEHQRDALNEWQSGVEGILRPDQCKRLTEIDLQWRGVLALGDKRLSNRLGVSPAHHQRIAEILKDFFVKRLRLLSPYEPKGTQSPRYQERQILLQETEQKVLALLSDEEKGRWAQAVGQPFLFED